MALLIELHHLEVSICVTLPIVLSELMRPAIVLNQNATHLAQPRLDSSAEFTAHNRSERSHQIFGNTEDSEATWKPYSFQVVVNHTLQVYCRGFWFSVGVAVEVD